MSNTKLIHVFSLDKGQRFRFLNVWWTITDHQHFKMKAELCGDSTAHVEFTHDRFVEVEQ